MRRLAAFAAILLVPSAAWAHGVAANRGAEPWLVVALAASLALYAVGIARLWRSAGLGRGVGVGKAALFVAGWATLAAALVSPLAELAGESFAAHMIEHELLMAVAAPILVLSRPLGAMVWALPATARRAMGSVTRAAAIGWLWRAMLRPGPAWGIHALALWLWHAPLLFQAALADPGAHAAQHASFLAAALIYWWSLLRWSARVHRGIAILSLFATSLHASLLGALLAVSTTIWYAAYRPGPGAFGLSPLEDQQLAGLIMWVPSGLVYVGAALALMVDLLRDSPRRGGIRVART